MAKEIKVAILDDHQSIIDGYLYRLRNLPEIQVVGKAEYGEKIEVVLAEHKVDVLILDVNVPTGPDNPNMFPILYLIPKWRQMYPGLKVLPISMHAERPLIQSIVQAGASGYILKDDHASVRQLGRIVASIANGGVYFSDMAHRLLMKSTDDAGLLTARQLEVLNLFAAYPHLTSSEAAERLHVADSTVRNLLSGIYHRLDVPNRVAAITKAQQLGLIPTTSATQIIPPDEEDAAP